MRKAALVAFATWLALGVVGAEAAGSDRFGKVSFPTTCSPAAHAHFERGLAMLHSFWFGPAIKAFEAAAQADPACGIAHWGAAVAWIGNPLAGPPSESRLKSGAAAVARARAAGAKSQRERDYIAAIEAFYRDHDKADHRTRALAYEKAMEALAQRYPQDDEASIFYALALNITLDPKDKTYANQLKAASILEPIFTRQPDHPGVAHYLIHSYDFPPIAQKGLAAARRYASIAPSAPHALHMPSHIFTRVGAWQESAASNLSSASVAKAEKEFTDQLHAMDYLVYAYLQLARDTDAQRVVEEAPGVRGAEQIRATPYALAAIPARYAIERGAWKEAAQLQPQATRFRFTAALTHFARALGAARSGGAAAAERDVQELVRIVDAMKAAKDAYWAIEVEVQRLGAAAWVAFAKGTREEALTLMRAAADLEDTSEKAAVSPGRLVPARELLGDMLLESGQPAEALAEYERSQVRDPNRYRSLYGAGQAAAQSGNRDKARYYFSKLTELAGSGDPRPETEQARRYLASR